MATNAAIAIKRNKAQEKLEKAARRIGRVAGIDVPDLNPRARQPGMIEAMRTEILAEYLTDVAEALYRREKELEQLTAEAEKTPVEAPQTPEPTEDTKTAKKGG